MSACVHMMHRVKVLCTTNSLALQMLNNTVDCIFPLWCCGDHPFIFVGSVFNQTCCWRDQKGFIIVYILLKPVL